MPVEFFTLADRRLAYQRQVGKETRPGIIFLGGFASDMHGSKAVFLAERCQAENISFVRFDYGGCGQSSGNFADQTIGTWYHDVLAIFDALTQGPQIIIGSSMGGWLAFLLARVRPERVKALVGIAAAPDFTSDLVEKKLSPAQRETLKRDGKIYEDNAPPNHRFPITLKLLEEARQHMIMHTPLSLACPVRLLQGMRDTEVPWQYALRIAEHIDQVDTHITFIKNGDHRLSAPDHLDLLWRTVAAFL